MSLMLSTVVFSGRYYLRGQNREIEKLVRTGLLKVEKDSEQAWVVATEKGQSRCSVSNLPPLPELNELGLNIYNQIRVLARNNRQYGYDHIWNIMLQLYPGKFKTIREAVCYYMVGTIKNHI